VCDRPASLWHLRSREICSSIPSIGRRQSKSSTSTAPREAQRVTRKKFADDVARSTTMFSDMFGPLPSPGVHRRAAPRWHPFRDFRRPRSSASQQTHLGSPRLRSHHRPSRSFTMVGQRGAARPHAANVWISDGLARYSEALYAEQNAGKEAGLKAVLTNSLCRRPHVRRKRAPSPRPARLAPYSPGLSLRRI